MRATRLYHRLALVLLGAALIAGCAKNSASTETSYDPVPKYFEWQQGRTVYVVSNIEALELAQAGRPLPKIYSTYGQRGETLIVEADATGLEQRLMTEYQRRHRPR